MLDFTHHKCVSYLNLRYKYMCTFLFQPKALSMRGEKETKVRMSLRQLLRRVDVHVHIHVHVICMYAHAIRPLVCKRNSPTRYDRQFSHFFSGQLGVGDHESYFTPRKVKLPAGTSTPVAVCCGPDCSVLVTSSGELLASGSNRFCG